VMLSHWEAKEKNLPTHPTRRPDRLF
jgi:hypothetical protein